MTTTESQERSRAEFEAWAELTDHQKRGTQHDVVGWYYFDDTTEVQWQAWSAALARAGLAAPKFAAFEDWLASSIEPPAPDVTGAQRVIDYARLAFDAGRAGLAAMAGPSEQQTIAALENAAQALLDRALGHYRLSNFTLQEECLQCVEVVRDVKNKIAYSNNN